MPLRFAAALALLLSGCGLLPVTPIDTARIVPGEFASGLADQDVSAVYIAQWAFADPARTAGRPVEAARAVAAMDYIAGQLNTSPRWANIPAIVQQQLLQGRVEVRNALGVAPGARSQAVVDQMSTAANALAVGNRPAALAELGPPTFVVPSSVVLARLTNMPRLPEANVATMRAANSLFRPGDFYWR